MIHRFPKAVVKRAFDIIPQLRLGDEQIDDPIGAVAAVFYVASILENAALTQRDIAEQFEVNEQRIRRAYPRIREVLRI